MSEYYHESAFFQSMKNVQKLGAFYTDVGHCQRIGNLFDFGQAEEICVLEPSIGDGAAVRAVTNDRENCRIFGVEIQRETYQGLLENEQIHYKLNQDFLRGVKISRGVFSFCFMNPPYGEERDCKKRLEQLFIEKAAGYLKTGAYMALVIPHYVFKEDTFLSSLLSRFELCAYYRFDDKEYEKFKQVCVILKKKRGAVAGYLRSDKERIQKEIFYVENFPYLPGQNEEVERLEVLPSKDSDVQFFTSLDFDPEAAAQVLDKSNLYHELEKMFQKKYRGCDLENPVMPVSNDTAYLLAAIGGGQGYAGSEADRTLHLQRGTAERIEEESVGDKQIVNTSYTKVKLTILEESGKITVL